jgi:hypothetical protein
MVANGCMRHIAGMGGRTHFTTVPTTLASILFVRIPPQATEATIAITAMLTPVIWLARHRRPAEMPGSPDLTAMPLVRTIHLWRRTLAPEGYVRGL